MDAAASATSENVSKTVAQQDVPAPGKTAAQAAKEQEKLMRKSKIQWFYEETAVLFYLVTFGLQLWTWGIVALIMYFFPSTRLPFILYITYITVGPGKDASANPFSWPQPLRWAPWQKYIASYFPVTLVRDTELSPQERYIFCFHPHGILAMSAWSAFATEACGFSKLFPNIRVATLTLKGNFRAPGFREYLLMHGMGDVNRSSCLKMLSKAGQAIMIAVGGASESLLVRPFTYDLVLKRRKGFVRLALQTGAHLVPTISFGENDVMDTTNGLPESHWMRRTQRWMEKKLGFTTPIIHGKGPYGVKRGLMPYRKRTTVVTGPPLVVPQYQGDIRSEEAAALVDKYHEQYIAALHKLWDKYKEQYAADREGELRLIE